ncbi:MAG: hypothetical protein ACWGOX_11600 [Desulforhopalus sp.]
MKTSLLLFIFLIPTALSAQNNLNMNQADMQNMMQQMQQMQECMASIDQAELDTLQKRSEEFTRRIEALCSQGKRDQAQQEAMSFGQEMAGNPSMKKMQECGKLAQGMVPGMPHGFDDTDYSQTHVCDQ